MTTSPLFSELPDWIDTEAWEAFLEMRKEKGKRAPFTPRARSNMLLHLDRMRKKGHSAEAINEEIFRSARSGWSDIYEPKAQPMRPNGHAVAPWVAEKTDQVNAWTGGRAGVKPAKPVLDIGEVDDV
jgi:hypothetical protein